MRFCTSLVLSILVGTVALAAEKGYEIKIHRPDKAGMKFDVAITSALKKDTDVHNSAIPPMIPRVAAWRCTLRTALTIADTDVPGKTRFSSVTR